jgi:hypothetical protein
MSAAIRLATLVMVVTLLGLTASPWAHVEAAGGSPYVVRIARFCRGVAIGGSDAIVSFKVKIALENTGSSDIEGTLRGWSAAMGPGAVDPYHDLIIAHDPVLLHPGETVTFVANVIGLNMARTTRFAIGVAATNGNLLAYRYTAWYAAPAEIPVC